MKRRTRIAAALVAALLATLLFMGGALADAVSTTVTMRISHMTQSAVVDAGEDLSIEVSIDGVAPSSYQWYFNGVPIEGANQKVYNIADAKVEDSGIYRLDAFDENGAMLVSMDLSARVIDRSVPKSGDSSMPVSWAFTGMAVCGALLACVLLVSRRREARQSY